MLAKEARATQTSVEEQVVQAFAATLDGQLIRPGDAAYDETRAVWNGMIDRHPALIARCASAADVVAAVHFAREHNILLSVRGGGHNVAGHGTNDGGLVIDLSLMRDVIVDPETNTVHAQGGATIRDVDTVTQQYGLAVPLGLVSATGIAGLTLGGGYNWLRSKYGLACDNLIGAEVVTADGRIVRASAEENGDLLWGLRGGGGNFGIVTKFTYRAHPIGPDVTSVFVFHDAGGDRMEEAIAYYREFTATAPDDVSTLLSLGIIPPDEELFPAAIHGKPFALFAAMYAGPSDEGEAIMRPLHEFGEPLIDFSGVMPYLQLQTMFDEDYPDGMRYYWKSVNLMELNGEAIARIATRTRQQPSVLSTVDLWHIGGAVKRFTDEDSAFYGRHAAFLLNPEANWVDPAHDDANVNWVRALVADVREFSDGSRYLNFAGFQEEGDAMMRDSFGPQLERLQILKQEYDPDNLFRLNQNVKPAQSGEAEATSG